MENTPGKFCPVCKLKNDVSATTCSFCGASLENLHTGEATTKHMDTETRVLVGSQGEESANKGIVPPQKGVAIYLQDGTLIETKEEPEFFLGRKFEDSQAALVDLIPFGAFQMGVSRRHAQIRRTEHGYELIDLDSTNGTFMDGKRLISNQPYPLPNFSPLSLGRLNLLVIYAQAAHTDKTSKR
jgi:hypothetical protein